MPSHANGIGKHRRIQRTNWLLIAAITFILAGSAYIYWQGMFFFFGCTGDNEFVWFANYGLGCYVIE